MGDSVFSFRNIENLEPLQPSGSFEDKNGVSFGGPRLGLSRNKPRGLGGNLGGSGVFAQYEGATREEQFAAALSQPMSLSSTLVDQTLGGGLSSYGIGTGVRDLATPQGDTEPSILEPLTGLTVAPLPGAFTLLKGAVQSVINKPQPSLSKEEYESSAFARDSVPWDEGMTEDRAASLALQHDAKKVREYYAEKRPFAAFIGNLAGQALDPINYVPVAGPLVKAASVARFGKVAGTAAASSLDAAGNTAVFALATARQRATYGDDVSWQTTVSQIATAALIGSAFGTIGGVLEARRSPTSRQAIEARLATLKTTQEARIALNEGIDALVRGEDVALTPNATEPMAKIAGRIIRESETVRKAATMKDVAESLRVVSERNPELDVGVSPSEFDRLILADLQVRGFDGIQDAVGEGAIGRATPLSFDVETIEAPRVTKDPTVLAVEAAMKPHTPQAALLRKAEATARLAELERREAIANRPHNLAARKLDEWGLPSWDFMRFQKVHMIPDLKVFYRNQIKEADAILSGRVPPKVAMNGSRAAPEPLPEGRMEAETRIARPDDYKAMAEQYQVDPRDGSFFEEADIAQLELEGRLTDDDRMALADSQADFDNAVAYGNVLEAAVRCLI